MKPKDAFATFDEYMARRDVSPAQCRAGRGLLGWDEYDLSDAASAVVTIEGEDIRLFEEGEGEGNLNKSDRYWISEAFRLAGVTPYRTKNGEGVRISHRRRAANDE